MSGDDRQARMYGSVSEGWVVVRSRADGLLGSTLFRGRTAPSKQRGWTHMSSRKGDKARFNRLRLAKIRRRLRMREHQKELAAAAAKAKTKAKD